MKFRPASVDAWLREVKGPSSNSGRGRRPPEPCDGTALLEAHRRSERAAALETRGERVGRKDVLSVDLQDGRELELQGPLERRSEDGPAEEGEQLV